MKLLNFQFSIKWAWSVFVPGEMWGAPSFTVFRQSGKCKSIWAPLLQILTKKIPKKVILWRSWNCVLQTSFLYQAISEFQFFATQVDILNSSFTDTEQTQSPFKETLVYFSMNIIEILPPQYWRTRYTLSNSCEKKVPNQGFQHRTHEGTWGLDKEVR